MTTTQNLVQDWQAKATATYLIASALRAANPHLCAGSGPVVAAKNIRIELKRIYPKTKFSVKTSIYSMGNNVTVSWTDGPTSAQVETIINKYEAGTFDGQTDSYDYHDSAWTDAFGRAKYVSTTRKDSDAAILDAYQRLQDEENLSFLPDGFPFCVETYRLGGYRSLGLNSGYTSLQSLINVRCAETPRS